MTPLARARRFSRIKELGCICCRMRGWFSYPEIHHLNFDGKAGQARRGDEYTVGICEYHHRGLPMAGVTAGECRRCIGPSLKLESRAFREMFGSDDELLRRQNELIAQAERNAALFPLQQEYQHE